MSFVELSTILGNIGEFVGAIAVVLTLFYLAIQVKHSKEATEANTRALDEDRKLALVQTMQTNTGQTVDYFLRYADSAVVSLFREWDESGLESLDTYDRSRLWHYVAAELYMLRNDHYVGKLGLLPENVTSFESNVMRKREMWETFGLVPERSVSAPGSFWDDVHRVWDERDNESEARDPA